MAYSETLLMLEGCSSVCERSSPHPQWRGNCRYQVAATPRHRNTTRDWFLHANYGVKNKLAIDEGKVLLESQSKLCIP
jgi:uncharacterized protein YceK